LHQFEQTEKKQAWFMERPRICEAEPTSANQAKPKQSIDQRKTAISPKKYGAAATMVAAVRHTKK
jgi:hypothetical protein